LPELRLVVNIKYVGVPRVPDGKFGLAVHAAVGYHPGGSDRDVKPADATYRRGAMNCLGAGLSKPFATREEANFEQRVMCLHP
jgi:hypothetical protein